MEVVGCLGHLCCRHPPPSPRSPLRCDPSRGLTWHQDPPAEADRTYIGDFAAQGSEPLGSERRGGIVAGGQGSSGKPSQRMGSEAKQNMASDHPSLLGPPISQQGSLSATLLSRWEGLPGSGGSPAVHEVSLLGAGWQEGSGEAAHTQSPEGSQ